MAGFVHPTLARATSGDDGDDGDDDDDDIRDRDGPGHFIPDLKMRCNQYKIDFIEADIRQGYKQVLLPYLLKRERMF